MRSQTTVHYLIVIGLAAWILIWPWTRFWKREKGWVRLLFSLLGFSFIAWVAVALIEENGQFTGRTRSLLLAARHYLGGIGIGIAGSLAIAGKFRKPQIQMPTSMKSGVG